MQAWHCIAIITISVILFIYGTFRNEIEDHVYEQEVEKIMETVSASPEPKNTTVLAEAETLEKSIVDSPAWAEFGIILKCQSLEMAALHAQALKSNTFLSFFYEQIKSSTTASELIFSPFKSEFFIENEEGILRSLFSAHTTFEDDHLVKIICRGHSAKSAKLLATLILDSYELALVQERVDQPLPGSLLAQSDQIKQTNTQISELKEQLSQESHGDKRLNVEAIALKSEILMLDQELERFKSTLMQIDQLFKEGKPVSKYLEVADLSEFGVLKELNNSINELQNMLQGNPLEKAVRAEVKKNIQANQLLLENEIAHAIEEIKSKLAEGITRRKVLSSRIVDLHKAGLRNTSGNVKYRLLSELEESLEKKLPVYREQFALWKLSTYSVIQSAFVE